MQHRAIEAGVGVGHRNDARYFLLGRNNKMRALLLGEARTVLRA